MPEPPIFEIFGSSSGQIPATPTTTTRRRRPRHPPTPHPPKLFFNVDPDPNWAKILDPDPNSTFLDPPVLRIRIRSDPNLLAGFGSDQIVRIRPLNLKVIKHITNKL